MSGRRIVLLGVLWLAISGCGKLVLDGAGESRAGRPEQESWQVTIVLTKAGSKQALIRAGHLAKYSEKQFILLDQDVLVDFFDEREVHTSLMKSRQAEIDEKTNFMTAIGAVEVISDSGVVLVTDTLHWNSDLELVYTSSPVRLTTTRRDTLYGIGFESDASLSHWKVLQPSGVTERARDEH